MAERVRVSRGVREIDHTGVLDLEALIATEEPVILRGLAADWPLVQAGRRSPHEAAAYLRGFDAGRPVTGYVGDPAIRGRFHYDGSATAMNFVAERIALGDFLDRVLGHLGDAEAPAYYLGSTDVDTYLPGFRRENDLAPHGDVFDRHAPLASI